MDALAPNLQTPMINKVSALITPHSHCGNTRTNRKARKLSRSHRPWLSAKSHVQKDGGPTFSPHLQHITRYPRNWRNGARIFVMGTCAAVIVKVNLSEGDCCVYLTTTDEKPTVCRKKYLGRKVLLRRRQWLSLLERGLLRGP